MSNLSQPDRGSLPRDPDKVRTLEEQMEAAAAFISEKIGVKLEILPEDKLRVHIVEACDWIRQGAPGRALEVLEQALQLPPL